MKNVNRQRTIVRNIVLELCAPGICIGLTGWRATRRRSWPSRGRGWTVPTGRCWCTSTAWCCSAWRWTREKTDCTGPCWTRRRSGTTSACRAATWTAVPGGRCWREWTNCCGASPRTRTTFTGWTAGPIACGRCRRTASVSRSRSSSSTTTTCPRKSCRPTRTGARATPNRYSTQRPRYRSKVCYDCLRQYCPNWRSMTLCNPM